MNDFKQVFKDCSKKVVHLAPNNLLSLYIKNFLSNQIQSQVQIYESIVTMNSEIEKEQNLQNICFAVEINSFDLQGDLLTYTLRFNSTDDDLKNLYADCYSPDTDLQQLITPLNVKKFDYQLHSGVIQMQVLIENFLLEQKFPNLNKEY